MYETRLVAFDEATGERVQHGDTVTDFRGDVGILVNVDAASVPGKSGKVTVSTATGTQYNYDKVWGLRVERVPDVRPEDRYGYWSLVADAARELMITLTTWVPNSTDTDLYHQQYPSYVEAHVDMLESRLHGWTAR